jgi:hypothetical protein
MSDYVIREILNSLVNESVSYLNVLRYSLYVSATL